MASPRPFALIRTHDQWLRASHDATALIGETVQLSWTVEAADTSRAATPFPQRGAGLAFDAHCRLYHSVPDQGRVERLRWAAQDPLQPVEGAPAPVALFEPEAAGMRGDFALASPAAGPLEEPRGLAVDADERLYLAEAGRRRVLVFDLWAEALLETLTLPSTPVGLAAHGRAVYALGVSPAALFRLGHRGELERLPWPPIIAEPSRLAVSPRGARLILENAGTASAKTWLYRNASAPVALRFPTANPQVTTDQIPFATDLGFQPPTAVFELAGSTDAEVLVVARRPGEDFRRFALENTTLTELPPLQARGYDGLGIVATPDGRMAFWTRPSSAAASGTFRHAVPARLRYARQGSVTTFQLDSGEFQTVWGRVFLDACIPKGTAIQIRCLAVDEVPDESSIPRVPPANNPQPPAHPELSPPLPTPSLAGQLAAAPLQVLYRRDTGRELPWARPAANDPFETYEAPLLTDPGRYLWLHFEFTGNSLTSPRLRAVRAEYPSHDYLRRLPKAFSRDDRVASFLLRYLAIFEGFLGELEGKADARASLLDPRSAPAETLPWLASFVGLVLDERFARAPRSNGRVEDVRRRLLLEAAYLFRFRGTIQALRRFLAIYLDVTPILIEDFRLRGLGASVGGPTEGTSSSVLGAGFRVGGAVGREADTPLTGTLADAFATHAHRFTVMIPATLDEEAAAVVQQILDVHRPAHTLVQVCSIGSGMRVGRGLQVELTSIIGRTGGFQPLQITASLLGRGSIIGRPGAGVVPGGSRLGQDSRIG
jgi:phage tail-like protein